MDIGRYTKQHGFVSCEEIQYGWSEDRKFLVRDSSGKGYVLRVSALAAAKEKELEFAFLKHCNTLPFLMSEAISLDIRDAVYQLVSYVEGVSLDTVLPSLSNEHCYRLGYQASKQVKLIHELPLTDPTLLAQYDPSALRKRVLQRLECYEQEHFHLEGEQAVLRFVRANVQYLYQNPCCYTHGDFHCGNMVLREDDQVGIIDFNRFDIMDPYDDFGRLAMFDVPVSPSFAIGRLHGYFGKQIPMDFWRFYAVYMAYTSLHSLVWAKPFGEAEVTGFIQRYHRIIKDYQGFTVWIPSWYEQAAASYDISL